MVVRTYAGVEAVTMGERTPCGIRTAIGPVGGHPFTEYLPCSPNNHDLVYASILDSQRGGHGRHDVTICVLRVLSALRVT